MVSSRNKSIFLKYVGLLELESVWLCWFIISFLYKYLSIMHSLFIKLSHHKWLINALMKIYSYFFTCDWDVHLNSIQIVGGEYFSTGLNQVVRHKICFVLNMNLPTLKWCVVQFFSIRRSSWVMKYFVVTNSTLRRGSRCRHNFTNMNAKFHFLVAVPA